jgi:hypothetical protein
LSGIKEVEQIGKGSFKNKIKCSCTINDNCSLPSINAPSTGINVTHLLHVNKHLVLLQRDRDMLYGIHYFYRLNKILHINFLLSAALTSTKFCLKYSSCLFVFVRIYSFGHLDAETGNKKDDVGVKTTSPAKAQRYTDSNYSNPLSRLFKSRITTYLLLQSYWTKIILNTKAES